MCAIIKAYEKKMKKAIILCEIKEKSLKPYFTSKKEKIEEKNKIKPIINMNNLEDIKFTVLKDDYPIYDYSFKVIIIGDSGN